MKLFVLVLMISNSVLGQIRVGDPGVVFDESKTDDNYPEMLEWQKAGVEDGIPPLTNYEFKGSIEPMDAVALSSLLQSAATEGGGYFILNEGIYDIHTTVRIPSNIVLVGESREGTILRITRRATGGNAIDFIGAEYAGIQNLTIEGYYEGAFPRPFYMQNEREDFVITSVNFPSSSKNCWIQGCNILNSGSHAISSWNCKNITIRDCYIRGSYNKGGGGRGYVQISGNYTLFYNNVVKEMRHIAIQRQWCFNNVFFRNDVEQDFNFHNQDEGDNLVEQNKIRIPAELASGWRAVMGPWSTQHAPSKSDNYVFLNDAIEFNNNDTVTFSDPNLVYLGARDYERSNPFVTSTSLPSGGTFYPVTNVVENDVVPSFDKLIVYTEPQGEGYGIISPTNTPYHSQGDNISLSPEADQGSEFRYWEIEGEKYIYPNLNWTVEENINLMPTFTPLGESVTLTDNFTSQGMQDNNEVYFEGDQGINWRTTGLKNGNSAIELSSGKYLVADSISGGISSIEIEAQKEEATTAELALFINGENVSTFTVDGSDWIYDDLKVTGQFSLEIRHLSGDAKVDLSRFTWTGQDLGYSIAINSQDGETSTDPERSLFSPGESVMISATPFPGKTFERWAGDVTSEANPLQFTVNQNMVVEAVYSNLPGFFDFLETFDQANDGASFEGEYHLTWQNSGRVLEFNTDDKEIYLLPNQTLTSDNLMRGIDSIGFEIRNYLGPGLSRNVEVYINGELLGSAGNSETTTYTFESRLINIPATAVLEIRNSSAHPSAGVLLNNLGWSSHDGQTWHNLEVDQGGGAVAISPIQDRYLDGSAITISASSDDWVQFTEWTGSLNRSDNPLDVVIDQDLSITARYDFILNDDKLEPKFISANVNSSSPSSVDDLDILTSWDAATTNDQLTLDLQQQANIEHVYITWVDGDQRQNVFEIHTSQDGQNFGRALQASSSGDSRSVQKFDLAKEARAVRYIVKAGADGAATKISEIVLSGTLTGDPPLSVQEFEAGIISIYPNPTDQYLHIKAEKLSLLETSIRDLAGNLVKLISVGDSNDESIDVSDLQPGLYFLFSKTNQGIVKQKLIIRR